MDDDYFVWIQNTNAADRMTSSLYQRMPINNMNANKRNSIENHPDVSAKHKRFLLNSYLVYVDVAHDM